jgi:hypothetical protein
MFHKLLKYVWQTIKLCSTRLIRYVQLNMLDRTPRYGQLNMLDWISKYDRQDLLEIACYLITIGVAPIVIKYCNCNHFWPDMAYLITLIEW